jgi:DNA-binding transcriptional LysR family regulator
MKLTMPDLRMFAAVADLGGISAAARHLGRQKSTVSRDLALLEERLGARLVNRTTRHVSLTDAGEVLAAHARRVVEELEQAEAALSAMSDEPRGPLRLTAPYAVVRFVLAPQLPRFLARYPLIRLSIDPSTRVVDLVEEGLDLAIRVGELPSSSLMALKLADVPLVLVASQDYVRANGLPASRFDLMAHSLIDLQPGLTSKSWRLFEDGGKEVLETPVDPHMAIADPGIIIDMVLQGGGIAPVPRVYAANGLASGTLVHVLPKVTAGSRPVHAVYPSRRLLAPKVRVFLEFAEACLTGRNWG